MNNYNAHQDFKNKNGGIQLFVGGPTEKSQQQKIPYPHNPSHHRAPNKGRYESTFDESLSVCSTMGKKLCSKDELATANKAGYSHCECGWTSTKTGDQYWIGHPTNIDQWVEINRGSDQNRGVGLCGSPGLNQCGDICA